jgi:hypothetical protein
MVEEKEDKRRRWRREWWIHCDIVKPETVAGSEFKDIFE